MGAVRIVILVVAAVFAIGLAVIVRGLVTHKPPPPPPPVVISQAPSQPMSQVLVARRDLAVGTRLAQGDLGWQAWPSAALNPSFITDGRAPEAPQPAATVAGAETTASHAVAAAAASVVGGPMEARYGAIVRQPVLAGEPVTDAKLVRGGEGGFMSVVLRPGMRAIAVPISAATAAGGFVLPGDRVDVMQSHASEAAGGDHGFVAKVLLRNIRVLAIDQASQAEKTAQAMVGAVATLEGASADAEVLARAKAQGEMILALRAYSDAGGPAGRGDGGGADAGVVRILRNGQPSEVMVTP
jgi:pilus assembly protein CpaB